MNEIALDYILLSTPAMMGANFLVVILGGALGAWTWRGMGRMRRVIYFLAVAALTALLSGTQVYWLAAGEAIEGGYLGLLLVLTIVLLIGYGYATWALAAARSRDILGDTSNAFLAFIPFANLWLIFARGATADRTRSALGRYVGDPLLVIAGIFVFAIGNGVTKVLEQAAEKTGPISSPALQEKLADTMGVPEFLTLAAAEMKGGLPAQVDEITRLVSVTAEGYSLTYSYIVDTDVERIGSEFADQLVAQACRADTFRAHIIRGARIVYHYERPDRQILMHREITREDCGA